jgi:hypothetical protein
MHWIHGLYWSQYRNPQQHLQLSVIYELVYDSKCTMNANLLWNCELIKLLFSLNISRKKFFKYHAIYYLAFLKILDLEPVEVVAVWYRLNLLTDTEYLCQIYPRNHNSVFSAFITCHQAFDKSNTTSATSGTGSVYPYGVPGF